MTPGAIIVVDESPSATGHNNSPTAVDHPGTMAGCPLVCLDVLGKSVLERTIDKIRQSRIGAISVVGDATWLRVLSMQRQSAASTAEHSSVNTWLAAIEAFNTYAKNGVQSIIVIRLRAYMDFNLEDILQCHREQRFPATQIADQHGNLDFWVLDGARVEATDLPSLEWASFGGAAGMRNGSAIATYLLRGYVNRLRHPRDFRQLVMDSFRGQNQLLPAGREIQRGVWAEESAQIHRRAQLIGPVYVGRRAKLREDTLVARYSNVECDSEVDCGTAVQDSSILPNTYVGSWLDISHAVIQQSHIAHLARNVVMEISDRNVLRATVESPSRPLHEASSSMTLEGLAFAPSE